jgi:hypothetical protein
MEVKNKYKTETVPLSLQHNGKIYKGEAVPISTSCLKEVCFELDVTLNSEHLGTIYCGNDLQWKIRNFADQDLVNKIGEQILLWYE